MVNRTLLTCHIALLTTFAFGLVSRAEDGHRDPENEPDLARILEERRDVLRQLVAVRTEAYRAGRGNLESVVRSQRDLLHAQLRLQDDPRRRIELRSKAVELAKNLERIAESSFRQGSASQADILEARATRLDLQVELVEAEGRMRKEQREP